MAYRIRVQLCTATWFVVMRLTMRVASQRDAHDSLPSRECLDLDILLSNMLDLFLSSTALFLLADDLVKVRNRAFVVSGGREPVPK